MRLLFCILLVAAERKNQMKNFIKYLLQKILGFDNYLFLFSLYIIKTLKRNKKERDFLYFLDLIKNEGVIFDVGANIGIMSYHICKSFPNSSIYAFEPIPSNIKAFKRVIKHYDIDNINVIETAVGNVNGSVEMVMPVIRSVKLQGLSHVIIDKSHAVNEGDIFKSEIVKLDSFYTGNNIQQPLVAIKIDVENYEFFVLDGAKEIIEKYRPLIYCELWENQNREDCLKLIANFNYSAKVIYKNKLCNFDIEVHKTQNFFFIPNTQTE